VPLPLSDSTVGALEALLANVRLAEAGPEACGENLTVKEAEFPDARVTGKEIPLNVNSVLLMLADATVTEPPLAVSVPLWVRLLPTVTLPKFIALGATDSWPGVTPVPLNEIERFGLEPLEAIASVPLAVPPAVGVKVTLNV
jgi:hypothetical protein